MTILPDSAKRGLRRGHGLIVGCGVALSVLTVVAVLLSLAAFRSDQREATAAVAGALAVAAETEIAGVFARATRMLGQLAEDLVERDQAGGTTDRATGGAGEATATALLLRLRDLDVSSVSLVPVPGPVGGQLPADAIPLLPMPAGMAGARAEIARAGLAAQAQHAMSGRSTIIGQEALALPGGAALWISRHVTGSDGLPRGVLVATIDPARIASRLGALEVPEGGAIALLGDTGHLLARFPAESRFPPEPRFAPEPRPAGTGRPAAAGALGAEGDAQVMRARPVAGTGHEILVGAPAGGQPAAYRSRLDSTLLAGALALAAIWSAMAVVARGRNAALAGLRRAAAAETDRRLGQMEERLHRLMQQERAREAAVLNAVPAHMALLDGEGRIVALNESWQRHLEDAGVGPPDSEPGAAYLRGCIAAHHLPQATADALSEGLHGVLAGSRSSHVQEYSCREAGRLAWYRAAVAPITVGTEPRRVDGAVAMHIDITGEKAAVALLRQSEERLALAMRSARAGVWEWHLAGNRFLPSTQLRELLGLDLSYPADVARWRELLHPEDLPIVAGATEALLSGETDAYAVEARMRHGDGRYRWIDSRAAAIRDAAGRAVRVVGMDIDITERRHTERSLREAEARLRGIADHVPGFIFQWTRTPEGTARFTYVSPSAQAVLGIAAADLGRDHRLFVNVMHPDDRRTFHAAIARSATDMHSMQVEYRVVRPIGEVRWIRSQAQPRRAEDGSVIWDGIALDVTEQKVAEARLQYLAFHDPITGLPNRSMLEDRLKQLLVRAGRGLEGFAVHYLDLDHFKEVNDTLGHENGDQLLREVAERLRTAMSDEDMVARFGGDEFVVLQAGITERAQVDAMATTLMEQLQEPFSLLARRLSVSTTIGVVMLLPEAFGEGPAPVHTDVLKRADLALYEAKRDRRGSIRFFTPDMEAPTQERVTMRAALREGLRRREFRLHYQPQVDLATGRIIGAEALLRWEHPELGLLRPDRFIAFAEEDGILDQIGDWALEEACRAAGAWRAGGHPDFAIAVNVTAAQLQRTDMADRVEDVLRRTGFDPAGLELELTERTLLRSLAEVSATVARLHDRGVRFAIDDFGTGYASFHYLRDLKVDRVKIDGSFVRGVARGGSDAAIVTAMIAVARSLSLDVLAEGVETAEQWQILRDNGCEFGQGYYFSLPLAPEDMTWILGQGTRLPVSRRLATAG